MQQSETYHKMAEAIRFLTEESRRQPALEDAASHLNMSPHHFQRTFTRWAGVGPQSFLQYVTSDIATALIREHGDLAMAAEQAGLSGTGRLHDLFVRIRAMTPGEVKNDGEGLTIRMSLLDTRLGTIAAASTNRGICRLSFTEEIGSLAEDVKSFCPGATFILEESPFHRQAAESINQREKENGSIPLHLKGTPFQVQIWEALLRVPEGSVISYSTLAESAGRPSAVRAAASAVAANPVAWLIPCHRVIRSEGSIGNYRWGSLRKTMMLGAEASVKM